MICRLLWITIFLVTSGVLRQWFSWVTIVLNNDLRSQVGWFANDFRKSQSLVKSLANHPRCEKKLFMVTHISIYFLSELLSELWHCHSWKSLANHPTCDKKLSFMATDISFYFLCTLTWIGNPVKWWKLSLDRCFTIVVCVRSVDSDVKQTCIVTSFWLSVLQTFLW